MPAPLSHDLRIRVVEACKKYSKTQVAKLLKVDRKTVYRYLEQQAKEGNLLPKTGYQRGHSHKLNNLQELENHILQNPSGTLKSMGKKFQVSKSTVQRKLSKIGITKKRTPRYLERDEEERSLFLKKISLLKNDIIFVDETGVSDNEIPSYAWSHSGVRAFGSTRGRSSQRVSIAGSFKKGKLHSGMILDGTFNAQAFELYIQEILLPKCVPGDVIVMDNAQIHKSSKIRQAIENHGCHLLFQPKYSPDLNPIEHEWSPLKAQIRHSIEKDIREKFCLLEKASEIMKLRLS